MASREEEANVSLGAELRHKEALTTEQCDLEDVPNVYRPPHKWVRAVQPRRVFPKEDLGPEAAGIVGRATAVGDADQGRVFVDVTLALVVGRAVLTGPVDFETGPHSL